jgi:uroporphyrinogen-III synthase
MAQAGPLAGRTIAILEARRSTEIARLIERQGGTAYITPIVREVPVEDPAPLRAWLQRLAVGQLDLVVFLSGVGCRALLTAADQDGSLQAVYAGLSQTRVVARGPKPVQVLKEHGIHIDYVPPEPNTSEELLAAFAEWQLRGRTVGLQLYGGTTPYLERLRGGLASLGAKVDEVAPYRWEGPTDDAAVRELIEQCLHGRIDALAIFSSSQIHNLFTIAEEHDVGTQLKQALSTGDVVIASVGPVATEAIRSHGLPVQVQPEHPKMGHVVLALAGAFGTELAGSQGAGEQA